MLFIFSLALVSLTIAGDTADTPDTPDTPDVAPPATDPVFIGFTPDNVAAFGTMANLIEIAGESDGAGLLVGPGGVGADQQIVNVGDFSVVTGGDAMQTFQCGECDYPVVCGADGSCTYVYKPDQDSDYATIADASLLTPVRGLDGNVIAAPGLAALGIPLAGMIDDDLYKLVGLGGVDGIDFEDLMNLQASGLGVAPLPTTGAAAGGASTSDLVSSLAALYAQNGGENPLSDESLQGLPAVQAFIAQVGPTYAPIQDGLWGESDVLTVGLDGQLTLNPDNLDRLMLASTKPISSSSSSKKVYQDPFFWSFVATSVILVSLLGITCTRKRRNVTLDDVLMETNYSSHA